VVEDSMIEAHLPVVMTATDTDAMTAMADDSADEAVDTVEEETGITIEVVMTETTEEGTTTTIEDAEMIRLPEDAMTGTMIGTTATTDTEHDELHMPLQTCHKVTQGYVSMIHFI